MPIKRLFALLVLAAAVTGCKSVNVPAVAKLCCGSASCGCANGDCCSPVCCAAPAEALPMPRVVLSSEAAR